MSLGERAIAAVPRARFVPDRIYVRDDETGWLVALDRGEAPEAWRAHVDSVEPVVTQVEWDPRMPVESRDEATGRGRFSTSSSSALNVMARMIDALDLRPGARVLEIGTGTGYNAAVLAHIVGEGNVTSVEVDAELADRARQALEGYGVEVVVGDGRHGHRDGAPYDRLISTAAVSELPSAWEEQVRPDGIIVAPWADGTLGIITVGEGARVEPDAPFMMMRP